jgi:hypothetical protein
MIAVTTQCLPVEAVPHLPACAAAGHKNARGDATNAAALSHAIWQRALLTGDQRAWQVVYQEHNRQVGAWVKAQLRFPVDAVTRQTLIDDAFVKMASTFTRHPEKFADYPNLAALLGLLRLCAQRVVQDYVTACQQEIAVVPLESIAEPAYEAASSHAALQEILAGLLHGAKEWLVVTQLLLEEGKPRRLYAEHPDLFATVDEINTIRERVKGRLQRNQSFRHYLQV